MSCCSISTTVEAVGCLWTTVSVLGRSDKVTFSAVEVVQACFSTRNVIKPNFHDCRVCAMLADACISAGNIRQGCFLSCGGFVEVVQAYLSTRNVL